MSTTSASARAPPPLDYVLSVYAGLTMILMVPVSITVFLVVWAVKELTPLYVGRDQSPVYLAADESSAAPPEKKLESSAINALVIVAMIVVITFLMVLLYKLRCMKVIVVWFVISALLIFGFFTWIWIDLVCTKYQIPYDYLGTAFFLWNFAVVGIVAIFYYAPAKMGQAYLVALSVIMAWMLTRLPEWTTWAILLAVAVYDIVAVLLPKGPLQMLVREAQERNEPIPGFVYDSGNNATLSNDPPARGGAVAAATTGGGDAQRRASTASSSPTPSSAPRGSSYVSPANLSPAEGTTPDESAQSVPVVIPTSSDASATQLPPSSQPPPSQQHDANAQRDSRPSAGGAGGAAPRMEQMDQDHGDEEEEEDPFASAHDASPFKLGLGDFIFYSLLVGRAAEFSYVSWMTCYVCVINGLVGTLTCLLFLRGKVPALPALPISIFTGVAAYFITRYTTVPYTYYLMTSGLTV